MSQIGGGIAGVTGSSHRREQVTMSASGTSECWCLAPGGSMAYMISKEGYCGSIAGSLGRKMAKETSDSGC